MSDLFIRFNNPAEPMQSKRNRKGRLYLVEVERDPDAPTLFAVSVYRPRFGRSARYFDDLIAFFENEKFPYFAELHENHDRKRAEVARDEQAIAEKYVLRALEEERAKKGIDASEDAVALLVFFAITRAETHLTFTQIVERIKWTRARVKKAIAECMDYRWLYKSSLTSYLFVSHEGEREARKRLPDPDPALAALPCEDEEGAYRIMENGHCEGHVQFEDGLDGQTRAVIVRTYPSGALYKQGDLSAFADEASAEEAKRLFAKHFPPEVRDAALPYADKPEAREALTPMQRRVLRSWMKTTKKGYTANAQGSLTFKEVSELSRYTDAESRNVCARLVKMGYLDPHDKREPGLGRYILTPDGVRWLDADAGRRKIAKISRAA